MAVLKVAILEAEARFHRERLALYRARRYGSRPTSETRFRQLERASELAERRLQLARQAEPVNEDLRTGNDRRQVDTDIAHSDERRHPRRGPKVDNGGQRRAEAPGQE
jgi:hypothetical protein